ncbi:hypothetical protein EON66_03810 [archaeon]|nr:MAG: hypothetical protein EON66_03810 [archaeon]
MSQGCPPHLLFDADDSVRTSILERVLLGELARSWTSHLDVWDARLPMLTTWMSAAAHLLRNHAVECASDMVATFLARISERAREPETSGSARTVESSSAFATMLQYAVGASANVQVQSAFASLMIACTSHAASSAEVNIQRPVDERLQRARSLMATELANTWSVTCVLKAAGTGRVLREAASSAAFARSTHVESQCWRQVAALPGEWMLLTALLLILQADTALVSAHSVETAPPAAGSASCGRVASTPTVLLHGVTHTWASIAARARVHRLSVTDEAQLLTSCELVCVCLARAPHVLLRGTDMACIVRCAVDTIDEAERLSDEVVCVHLRLLVLAASYCCGASAAVTATPQIQWLRNFSPARDPFRLCSCTGDMHTEAGCASTRLLACACAGCTQRARGEGCVLTEGDDTTDAALHRAITSSQNLRDTVAQACAEEARAFIHCREVVIRRILPSLADATQPAALLLGLRLINVLLRASTGQHGPACERITGSALHMSSGACSELHTLVAVATVTVPRIMLSGCADAELTQLLQLPFSPLAQHWREHAIWDHSARIELHSTSEWLHVVAAGLSV